MSFYLQARASRFFVDAFALTAMFFVLTTAITTLQSPLSWPGPADPWASPDERQAANDQQTLWVEDFNARDFDPRYLPQVGWPDSILREFMISPLTFDEMLTWADYVFIGGLRDLTYVYLGNPTLTFVVEESLAGALGVGNEIVLHNRLARPFQLDPVRDAYGSIVSGRAVLRIDPIQPPIFPGDRVLVLASRVYPSHGEPFDSSWSMPYFPIRLGRIQAPAYPELDGMHLDDFVAYISRNFGLRPLYR